MTPLAENDHRSRDRIERETLMRAWNAAARQKESEQLKVERLKQERAFMEYVVATMATPQTISAFQVKLDRRDEASVKALLDNEEAREKLRQQMKSLLNSAHVLPDGRRVFKTEDGQQVFDEQGVEVSRRDLDPDQIEDHRPKWETFNERRIARKRLDDEREAILDYQGRLDKARDRLKDKDLTDQDLDDMDKALDKAMPPAVRRAMADKDPLNAPASSKAAFNQSVPDMAASHVVKPRENELRF